MDSIKGSSVSLFIYFIPCYKIQTANVKSLKLFRSASARQSPLRHSDPEASSLLQGQKRPRLCPKKPVTANHYRPSLNTRKTFLPRIISFSYFTFLFHLFKPLYGLFRVSGLLRRNPGEKLFFGFSRYKRCFTTQVSTFQGCFNSR